MARRPSLGLWAALAALAGAPPALPAEEEAPVLLYKWVDTNGIAHYTTDPERIPEELRGRLDALRREVEPAPPAIDPDDPWAALDPTAREEPWAVQDARVPEAAPSEPFAETPTEAAAPGRQAERRALDERIAELEAEIRRDEDRLQVWIADPAVDPVALADDPEFREIARRLPRLQDDLEALERERAELGGAPAAPGP
jgi:hypothetical protein